MKIEIRPEISILMCNCAAVKRWRRSVAWFPSYEAKCMSLYTLLGKINLCSCKKAARKSAKTVGKDSRGESSGLHCAFRQKDNHIQTGSL